MMTLPSAQVVHSSPGRARLRVSERAGDETFFGGLAAHFQALPSVTEIRVSARTASVLLSYQGELSDVLEHAGKRVLLQPVPHPHPMGRIQAAIDDLDTQIAAETSGKLSLGGALFFCMVAAGLWQARQGRFFPAGMTMFKYALDLMGREAIREDRMSHKVTRSDT